MKPTFQLRHCLVAFTLAAAILLIASGCSNNIESPTGMPKYAGTGQAVILIHDAPVDSLQEVWLTVNSVRLIGDESGASQQSVLTEPMRMDLLALQEVSRVLSVSDLDAQTFSKIRLEVSDPEFVDKNGNVVDASQIKLVANGKVDLNFTEPVEIVPDELTVVSLDLDLENSVLVNETGNGKYILRPQVKVDPEVQSDTSTTPLEMMNATIIRTNQTLGTIDLELPGSPAIVVVQTNAETVYFDANGDPMTFADLRPASQVVVYGYLDTATNTFVAVEVREVA